jgi:hypothetical protein
MNEPTELEQLIVAIEARWEDPYVDFKRQLSVRSKAEKAEFLKDVLGLVNTKGVSRRFLMIGWDDKSRQVCQPGIDPSIKVERLQHILNAYCEVPPHLELSTCVWGGVEVGILEVIREDVKLPYRIGKSIGSLKPGDVFVRHGTTTEPPSPHELEGLHQEGLNAKLREAAHPLIRPDQAALHFAPMGLIMGGVLPPDAGVRHQGRAISIALADAVPESTRKLFVRLQTIHMHGLWSPEAHGVGGDGYQLFTVAHDFALQVLEHALAARFIEHHRGVVELVDMNSKREMKLPSIEGMYAALDGRRWLVASRKRPGNRISFDGSLTDLFAWARHEGLLPGQSTRRFDYVFPRMLNRNRPIDYRVGSPPDSSRTIREVAEFINKLWGENTPGGHVFPGPSERALFALGWNAEDTERQVFRPEHFRTEPPRAGWSFIVALCTSDDELLDQCHSDFAVTTFPSKVLHGPSNWAETAAFMEAYDGRHDAVENLDQYFVLPMGRDEWARTPNQFAGLPRDYRSGRWVLIQADSPWAAYRHMRNHSTAPELHRLKGACGECWVSCVTSGGWRHVLNVLSCLDVEVEPEPPRGIARAAFGSPELHPLLS